MFAYGIDILPLIIRLLKAEFPAVEQPWYADDAGAGGKFADIRQFFCKLQEIGLNYGCYPEPTKSIMGETLLGGLWIRQCTNEHCHMQSYPPLPPRVPNPNG
jgi:hypothetical protein